MATANRRATRTCKCEGTVGAKRNMSLNASINKFNELLLDNANQTSVVDRKNESPDAERYQKLRSAWQEIERLCGACKCTRLPKIEEATRQRIGEVRRQMGPIAKTWYTAGDFHERVSTRSSVLDMGGLSMRNRFELLGSGFERDSIGFKRDRTVERLTYLDNNVSLYEDHFLALQTE
ncbi:hypothetical protein K491DRAFT_763217 [Lophiostoma macrostomum CBS 122681]|uniref:Uncharacterized protein n=1 Tax=Lophiostoma macrostomum CBS 122681 TaxID=1314788 RepID=A0A6A6SLA6_9PLEO|nr:hypothetical protein K491DRAFT_763217 [Lophiostoma macrostomum CBS 122681]